MDNKKIRIGATDIILLAASIIFFIGNLTFISACGPKEDGSWMNCHWAGAAVTSITVVLMIITALHLFIADRKIKAGISMSVIPTAILSLIIPGNIINLCMMDTMRCHQIMHPGIIVFSVIILVTAVVDVILNLVKK